MLIHFQKVAFSRIHNLQLVKNLLEDEHTQFWKRGGHHHFTFLYFQSTSELSENPHPIRLIGIQRQTLHPLFRERTFSLKISYQYPVYCFETKNSTSGAEISIVVAAIVVVSFFFPRLLRQVWNWICWGEVESNVAWFYACE